MSDGDVEKKVDWVRGPKTVNLSNVPTNKLLDAKLRGVEIEPNADHPEKAKVSKVVVSGLPAPDRPKES